jgi:hypothetical protein
MIKTGIKEARQRFTEYLAKVEKAADRVYIFQLTVVEMASAL